MEDYNYSLETTWRLLLKDLGIVAGDALRRANLPEDLLQRANVRLSAAEYYRFWRGIEAEMPADDLPVRICQAMRSENFSPPIFAALCSPNLLVAGRRIAKFKPLIAPIRIEISEDDTTASVEWFWLDQGTDKPATLVLVEMMISVVLARIGTREHICPTEVMTPDLIPATKHCETYLDAPIIKGAKNRITFRKADVLRPFLTSNESLWHSFEPALRLRLADLAAVTSAAQRVRAALLEGLPSGQTSIDAIASRLAMSKRTLQRRIEAEGVSYQDILAETRQCLALHYLEKTMLPVPEISFLLGFEEPNSFYRAFKVWTGTTPERVRSAPR